MTGSGDVHKINICPNPKELQQIFFSEKILRGAKRMTLRNVCGGFLNVFKVSIWADTQ